MLDPGGKELWPDAGLIVSVHGSELIQLGEASYLTERAFSKSAIGG